MITAQEIKDAARGRETELLCTVGGFSDAILDRKHHPCPKCGGKDRFRLVDHNYGAVLCNQCFNQANGDFLSAIRWNRDWDFKTTLAECAQYLGLNGYAGNGHATANGQGKENPLEVFAREKRCPAESIKAYGGEADGDELSLPMWGPDVETSETPCSFFRWRPGGGKGRYDKGKKAGLFLPGRTFDPGERVLIVEGCKKPAALHGLGYVAAGLPGNVLGKEFAPLFRGCHVTVLPDNDEHGAGFAGAQKTAERLSGIAASVRVATRVLSLLQSASVKDVRGLLPDKERELRAAIAADEQPAGALHVISSSDFDATDYEQRYLIRRILVANQPAICGGRSKVLKTSILCDLAVSLGTGTDFLGEFPAERCNVAFLSGESGAYTIQETARRVCRAKGVNLADASVLWGFALPQLGRAQDLDALRRMIKGSEIGVCVIDPAYLCLMAGDTDGRQASNIFDMGPLLMALGDIGRETGATIILCHHCRKNLSEPYQPPELEDLSMAGFGEWARQWLLLGRREAYEQGSGNHRLWMNVGGSAGHSGCWAVDVDEGELADDFTGRRWDVRIRSVTDARDEARRRRDQRKADDTARKEDDHRRKLLAALRQYPEGQTARTLRETAGLNNRDFGTAITFLLGEGRAERCEIEKANRKFEGYRATGN